VEKARTIGIAVLLAAHAGAAAQGVGSADKVYPDRAIVLPQDGSWYPVASKSDEFRIVVTQGDEISEHVFRVIESAQSGATRTPIPARTAFR
jgi:hypothetical protein